MYLVCKVHLLYAREQLTDVVIQHYKIIWDSLSKSALLFVLHLVDQLYYEYKLIVEFSQKHQLSCTDVYFKLVRLYGTCLSKHET